MAKTDGKKYLCAAMLAHVDSGKTTLSENILYTTGSIRKLGRVDSKDTFLDHYALERARGITIFSKQAMFSLGNTEITLLDTPGHVDFSAEMERTLLVLDYAFLVISGADGVQGHTKTLWNLLQKYQIPVFIFVNKMDQPGADKAALLKELRDTFGDGCVDFSEEAAEDFEENIAVCDERVLEKFLETGEVTKDSIQELIQQRKLFPCYFGSALKSVGITEFLRGVETYTKAPLYGTKFGARVFKITRDEKGNRLTFLKITGGRLKVKEIPEGLTEKVNQIRLYSGEKYETVPEVEAGMICAVTGPEETVSGMGLGSEKDNHLPYLQPVLTYQMILPEDMSAQEMLPKLRMLEEEEPELSVVWNEKLKEILVKVMGEVQIEILKSLILERFGVAVTFGTGSIVYRETIANTVEGVGHFEPLRHYAEVHLLLEPLETGSGLVYETDCSEDVLAKNWQRLILTHLQEKEHIGVLSGSAITDMKITLIAGRAHLKHTEGGDFREATYRALRQGLMQAESVLLEPYYEFQLEVPEEFLGRAMTDIDRRFGKAEIPETREGIACLKGMAPVICMQDYAKEVAAYTKGFGKLFCTVKGYYPCHNAEEVLEQISYDPRADLENTPDSVFCAHGSGFVVPWSEVFTYMHVESPLSKKKNEPDDGKMQEKASFSPEEEWLDPEEIDAILAKTYHANKKDDGSTKKWSKPKKKEVYQSSVVYREKSAVSKEEYLLVDGYNIIFAWKELSELARENLDAARGRLLDILCNYQGIRKCNLIAVFDAYRIEGHKTETLDYHNIHVVFTKEAETADQYIEKFAYKNAKEKRITVATSDGLEQIIITGAGCNLLSAGEFEKEVALACQTMKENYVNQIRQQELKNTKRYLLDELSEEEKKKISDKQ
ncbi:MAG: TetM/TetW/TetO/TetS family tetracycline resistance ribosomal protection protein [Lachnospiraceae bacterium]|nr:TetM/TetW/TetO/TetS family tetracycline resistance ribosomal protection protein [Lachnospiraceae bacterium]